MAKAVRTKLIFWLSAALLVCPRPGAAAESTRIVTDQNNVYITAGEWTLMRYRYSDVPYKPYVDRLFTPRRLNVLLDAPHDHLHHHGLMYAITVDGVNFWEEFKAPGRQAHVRFCDVHVAGGQGRSSASVSEVLDWKNPRTGELLLVEQRTIAASYLPKHKVTLLTWTSAFEPAGSRESITLTGSHYQGLGLRFIRAMDANGRFRNADGRQGKVFRGDERLVRSKWCAYTAAVGDANVTVAMFDSPDNERHPATWFTMARPFAYLSATLALHESPVILRAGKPLVLRYGVALWDGAAESKEIESVYEYWAAAARQAADTGIQQQEK